MLPVDSSEHDEVTVQPLADGIVNPQITQEGEITPDEEKLGQTEQMQGVETFQDVLRQSMSKEKEGESQHIGNLDQQPVEIFGQDSIRQLTSSSQSKSLLHDNQMHQDGQCSNMRSVSYRKANLGTLRDFDDGQQKQFISPVIERHARTHRKSKSFSQPCSDDALSVYSSKARESFSKMHELSNYVFRDSLATKQRERIEQNKQSDQTTKQRTLLSSFNQEDGQKQAVLCQEALNKFDSACVSKNIDDSLNEIQINHTSKGVSVSLNDISLEGANLDQIEEQDSENELSNLQVRKVVSPGQALLQVTARDSSTAQFLRDEIAAKYKLSKCIEVPSKTGSKSDQVAQLPIDDSHCADTKIFDASKKLKSKIQVKATPSENTNKVHRTASLVGKKRPKRVEFSRSESKENISFNSRQDSTASHDSENKMIRSRSNSRVILGASKLQEPSKVRANSRLRVCGLCTKRIELYEASRMDKCGHKVHAKCLSNSLRPASGNQPTSCQLCISEQCAKPTIELSNCKQSNGSLKM